jgi:hypothetical protein
MAILRKSLRMFTHFTPMLVITKLLYHTNSRIAE